MDSGNSNIFNAAWPSMHVCSCWLFLRHIHYLMIEEVSNRVEQWVGTDWDQFGCELLEWILFVPKCDSTLYSLGLFKRTRRQDYTHPCSSHPCTHRRAYRLNSNWQSVNDSSIHNISAVRFIIRSSKIRTDIVFSTAASHTSHTMNVSTSEYLVRVWCIIIFI